MDEQLKKMEQEKQDLKKQLATGFDTHQFQQQINEMKEELVKTLAN